MRSRTCPTPGRAFPVTKLEKIFEPFVQLTVGLADHKGGVGLGLTISRDLALAMGGDLTIESTVGVGSRFTLVLPLYVARRHGNDGKADDGRTAVRAGASA